MRSRSRFAYLIGVAAILNLSISAYEAAAIPAFPGAEGPGSDASGGRNGDVYHVTNLLDDHDGTITGSLRYGLQTAPSAGRTIVFDVGGTINLVADVHQSTHTWLRSGNPNITIAGQTAPGPGITIAGQGAKLSGDNWILRHVKFRPGLDQSRPEVLTNDGISNNLQNSIIDHVSVSWADDEGLSSTDAVMNTTVQYSIIGEGLKYGGHAFGSLISSENNDARLSYHHNLFIHNNSRNPRFGSESGTGAITNFSNNVIYNWSGRAAYSFERPSRTNFLSNYYIAGENTLPTDVVFYSPDTQTQIHHRNGNQVDMDRDGELDGVGFYFGGPQFSGTVGINLRNAYDVASGHVQSAEDAVSQVTNYVGAQWWDRDPVDQRLAGDLANQTGSHINYITEAPQDPAYSYDANGHPIYGLHERPAGFDSDLDGMPDEWEVLHGLNPGVADNGLDFDQDGYTNLEDYLNDLGAFPAPTTIQWIGGSGRYANIENWGISQTIPENTFSNWQPSRYDRAEINGGVVALDAVGQHAGALTIAAGDSDVAQLNVNAGWLVAAESLTIGGLPTSQATLNLTGGMLATPELNKGEASVFAFTGGELAVGQVGFDLVNNGGVLSPTGSGGQTTILGDLAINAGVLQIDIAAGEHDQVSVANDALLGGELSVALVDGLLLEPNTHLQILSVDGSSSGQFSGLGEGALVGAFGADLYITYEGGDGNDVVLFTLGGQPGDFNNDGVVDAADYTVWRDNLGGDEASLGGNGDGLAGVDQGDFALWIQNYGQALSGGQPALGHVPEPSTLACGLLAWAVAAPVRLGAARRGRPHGTKGV